MHYQKTKRSQKLHNKKLQMYLQFGMTNKLQKKNIYL